MSDYNYGLEPGIRNGGSSKVRFVLIFLIISAVTAAIVWWSWPGRVKGGDTEKELAPREQKSAAPTAIGEESESRQAPPQEKKIVKKEGTEKAPAAKESGKTENKTVPAADPTDPPVPAKGVITPADQKGTDLPVVVPDEVVTQEQHDALKNAADLLLKKDFSGCEKAAEKALAGVKENSKFFREAWRILTAARMGMVFQERRNSYVTLYRIKGGDSLTGIAGRFFTTVEFLRKKNNISGSRIFVGRSLYVVPGDWEITVSKKFRLLRLYRKAGKEKQLFALWEVGIGRMGKTPAAEFAIASRMRHPDWYLPDGRIIKYGDAENQLGDYFLKLAPAKAPGRPLLGYGIHGARDESAVGRSLSNGCIRMRNKDVECLFYLVPSGVRVTVSDE